jgi:uncharacterized protein (TIGR02391 family)
MDESASTMRRKLLEELHELQRNSPLATAQWSAERGDDEHNDRIREARHLIDAGHATGSIGGDGWINLKLTPRGREYVEGGGFWNPEPLPQVREAAVRRVGLENLHPLILAVSDARFTDGHYADAIFAAFRAIETRVRELSGLDATGKDLMARAFNGNPPPINMKVQPGLSGDNEQEGFRFLFMGAIVGIRNPKGHDEVRQDDPVRALEYLAFASLLMRRLDDAVNAPA